MQRNIGRAERAIRILLGLGVTGLALFGPHNPWAWLGLIPLLSGLAGWCPAYAMLHISTYEDTR
jgi:hypothetical protein